MSEIPNVVLIGLPFVLGHLIGYSWLTWQRKKRQRSSNIVYSSNGRPIRKYPEPTNTVELENKIASLESRLESLKQQSRHPVD